jgi:hypothetical protein
MEPRNVGVVVWIDGVTSARFLGEDIASGNAARAPRRLMVRSQKIYRQWLRRWREEMERPALSSNGSGNIPRESPEFLDALAQHTSKRQFVLVDGGFVGGKIDPRDIDEVVNDLFVGLVDGEPEETESTEEDSALLRKAVSRAVRDSGIERLKGYSQKLPLTFSVEQRTLFFTFDSGVYDTRPRLLLQHALLTQPVSVNSAAFMFSCIRKADLASYQLDQHQCLALTWITEDLKNSPDGQHELAKLEAYSTVVDLCQYDRAVEDFKVLASSLPAQAG